MDYKQHKGNLRGQIKNRVERKLYNKRIRTDGKITDTNDTQLSINNKVTHEHSCENCIWFYSAKKCSTCDENWSNFEQST